MSNDLIKRLRDAVSELIVCAFEAGESLGMHGFASDAFDDEKALIEEADAHLAQPRYADPKPDRTAELEEAKDFLREIRDHEIDEINVVDEVDKFLRDHKKSKRAELEADAARYRWLRGIKGVYQYQEQQWNFWGKEDELDAEIDKAREGDSRAD